MKKLALILFVLLLVIPSVAFAANGKVIPLGDVFYNYVDMLFLLNGKTIPSAARPWTVSEARNELSRLDRTTLQAESVELWEKVNDELIDEYDAAFSFVAVVSPEAYGHVNDSFDQEPMWNYGYNSRAALASGGLELYNKNFFFRTGLDYGIGRICASDKFMTIKEYVESQGKTYGGVGAVLNADDTTTEIMTSSSVYSAKLRSNLPASGELDSATPLRTFFIFANDNSSFGIYKGQKSWGKTSIGNYIYDKHVSVMNYVDLKAFGKAFNADFTIMVPESCFNGTTNTYYSKFQRLFLTHRFEVRPNDQFTFAFSENVMYWLNNGMVELGFINPATIYHNNTQNNLFNALASVELEYTSIKGLRLYAQAGIDQGTVVFFEKMGEEEQAVGLTVGSEYVRPMWNGLLNVNLEAAFTTPSLYRRGKQTPDFIISMNGIKNTDQYHIVPTFTYVGFPYGGDTAAFRLDGDYYKDAFHGHAGVFLMFKGETTMFDSFDKIMDIGLRGTIDTYGTLDVAGDYSFRLFNRFDSKVYGDAAVVFYPERGADLQVSLGASVKFSAVKGF